MTTFAAKFWHSRITIDAGLHFEAEDELDINHDILQVRLRKS